jgi:hypothetical protein
MYCSSLHIPLLSHRPSLLQYISHDLSAVTFDYSIPVMGPSSGTANLSTGIFPMLGQLLTLLAVRSMLDYKLCVSLS